MNAYVRSTLHCCETNAHAVTQIIDFMRGNGFTIVSEPDGADYIIISTCGVTETTEESAMFDIDSLAHSYGVDRIIVTGCVPNIRPDIKTKYRCIGVGELEEFNSLFAPRKMEEFTANILASGVLPEGNLNLHDYYIKIASGCAYNCSYCSIKKAKGYIKSVPIDAIVRQFKDGIGAGRTRFVLLGDDCGSYGVDVGTDLVNLLKELRSSTDVSFSISINYLHPSALVRLYPRMTEEMIRMISFIDIPMQSGSQRILELMNRRYDINEVVGVVSAIKRINPSIWIRTAFIYGFPTETREEFDAMYSVASVFSEAVCYQYSERGFLTHLPSIDVEECNYRRDLLVEREKQATVTKSGSHENFECESPLYIKLLPRDKDENR